MGKCLHCGTEIVPKTDTACARYNIKRQKFCSQKCNGLYNNYRIKTKICLHCGKLINNKQKYCSSQCKTDYEFFQYIIKWKAGIINGIKSVDCVSNYVRRYIFEKYNNSCSICGWAQENPYTKKIPLEIEHIDGNSKNNIESNLTLLCPNCHSQTSTYKGANKGNGRHSRRQRYKDGKSY